MKTVFSLRDDVPLQKYMQDISLSSSTVGLRPVHGGIGSVEWWKSVETGATPIQRAEGNISGFWPGQHGQGPAEFNLTEHNGTTTNWGCGIDPAEAAHLFFVGRRCAVEFVEQALKAPFHGRSFVAVAIRIELGEGEGEGEHAV